MRRNHQSGDLSNKNYLIYLENEFVDHIRERQAVAERDPSQKCNPYFVAFLKDAIEGLADIRERIAKFS